MPYSMQWSEQKNKWFAVMLFIILPFYVFFKILRKDLPDLKDISRPKAKFVDAGKDMLK